jgi:tRNA G10  N-methylase Trm11
MAPELALAHLADLPKRQIVLDPMSGSGTVLRQASSLGHEAYGFDTDPLAVLMSRVWTTAVNDATVELLFKETVADARKAKSIVLPWMDDDPESKAFAKYWFGDRQRKELSRLAFVLSRRASEAKTPGDRAAVDVLRLALSRIIITKDKGASLGRDISHSRPHKVMDSNDYDVTSGYERSVRMIRKRLADDPPGAVTARVNLGDARQLKYLDDLTVDAVLTSPPYLNAIDYMRGHRLSLIWLGHKLSELRAIRSNSIGSERAPGRVSEAAEFASMKRAMGQLDTLPTRFLGMIDRYVQDLYQMIKELARVLKVGGKATLVVGNSCLRGVFIKNAGAVETAAMLSGLTVTNCVERELLLQSRYLPVTRHGALGKRMRTETILSFAKRPA